MIGIIRQLKTRAENDPTHDWSTLLDPTTAPHEGIALILSRHGIVEAVITGCVGDRCIVVHTYAPYRRDVRKTFRVLDDYRIKQGCDMGRIDDRLLYADMTQFIDSIVNQKPEEEEVGE